MKIQYTKNYTDEYGQLFPKGCVAEHTESDANARIALGVACETHQDAYSRLLPDGGEILMDCVPEPSSKDEPKAKNK